MQFIPQMFVFIMETYINHICKISEMGQLHASGRSRRHLTLESWSKSLYLGRIRRNPGLQADSGAQFIDTKTRSTSVCIILPSPHDSPNRWALSYVQLRKWRLGKPRYLANGRVSLWETQLDPNPCQSDSVSDFFFLMSVAGHGQLKNWLMYLLWKYLFSFCVALQHWDWAWGQTFLIPMGKVV